ncbi:MAG: SIS domain-containing protein [Hyphomicrobiaceae bacterium]
MDSTSFVTSYLDRTSKLLLELKSIQPLIVEAAARIEAALLDGKKVIFCGNGGSAADAQHLAAEFMGRFLIDRAPMPALSLTVDTSALTAIGNDYGFENVFSRQLQGIAVVGDVLFGMSTSGSSANVVKAFEVARNLGVFTIGLTGDGGGKMSLSANLLIAVPETKTSHIQEAHITIGHMICAMVEDAICLHKQ